jgi:signal transduction histidine kinase
MSERLGVEKENAKGMLCFSLVHGEKKPLEGCPHALMGGDGETHSLVIHEKRLNSDFYVTVAPLKNQNGDLVGGVHVLYDITELKRAEESLHQANKKLNMLSSITRHDILNQLMGLRAFLELAGDGEMTQENKMFIGKAEEASMAIQRQIEFTRYYQDIGVQAPAWNDVEQMIRSSASQLGLQGIDLGVSIRGMEIYADPLAEKVFYNLMENSIRHGEKVTRIAFASRIADKGLIIEYTDDGIGISEEDRKRLFSRGFGKHTGLGLFLSREILSITGITIDENGTFGKSVRFEITVPRNAYRNTQGSHT